MKTTEPGPYSIEQRIRKKAMFRRPKLPSFLPTIFHYWVDNGRGLRRPTPSFRLDRYAKLHKGTKMHTFLYRQYLKNTLGPDLHQAASVDGPVARWLFHMVPEVAGRGRILDFFASKQFDYLFFDKHMPITV
jgi:hypothetical protein